MRRDAMDWGMVLMIVPALIIGLVVMAPFVIILGAVVYALLQF